MTIVKKSPFLNTIVSKTIIQSYEELHAHFSDTRHLCFLQELLGLSFGGQNETVELDFSTCLGWVP